MYTFLLQNGALRDIELVHHGSYATDIFALQWRHNDYGSVSNHQPHGCLLNRLFRRISKKISKLRVTWLCAGNSPGPVNSPHKGPVTRKMFPFDDVIMVYWPLILDGTQLQQGDGVPVEGFYKHHQRLCPWIQNKCVHSPGWVPTDSRKKWLLGFF